MITFQHISKSFGEKIILDGVSGAFQAGKVNLVIGGSGTGKSLLIKCVLGLLPADSGKVLFDQRDLLNGKHALQTTIRREIGVLFQGGALFDSKNIESNVQFPLDILTNMSLEAKKERVYFCLKQVGLPNVHKKMPNELSGGMKKRAGIARAIVNHPKYLFCDEPNSGLDPKTALMIDELIQKITYEYQTTTVIVTHDLNSIISLGDYILFLYEGKKAWEGNSENIRYTSVQSLREFLFVGKLNKLLEK